MALAGPGALGAGGSTSMATLSAGAGSALLVLYPIVAAVAGTMALRRRDIN